jgi:serine/threonine protein kinase
MTAPRLLAKFDGEMATSIAPLRAGRYELHGVIGAGGMATVHCGRLLGPAGFNRVVAIKRLHPYLASDRQLADRFMDEARLATRIRHANVVQTIDVVVDGEDCLVVMEYIAGATLSRLLQVACQEEDPPPPRIVSAILSGVLHGLHAAHQAKTERGEPLCIVHRDVSPQNILVGLDGIARILDFGIAKAIGRSAVTPDNQVRGKVSYMAPEQVSGRPVGPTTDVFASAIVLWETLVGRRLFLDETHAKTLENMLTMRIEPPSRFVPSLPRELDAVVLRGLERTPAKRFASARKMALALEQAVAPASPAEVGAWVDELAHDTLAARALLLQDVEASGVGPGAHPSDPVSYIRTHARGNAAPATGTGSSPDKVGGAARPQSRPHSRLLGGRRALFVTVAAGLTGILIGSVGFAFRGSKAKEQASAQVPEDAPVPAAVGPENPAPEPPTTSNAASVPVGLARSRVPARTRSSTPKVSVMSPSALCSPPYTYDSLGHKTFKRECF